MANASKTTRDHDEIRQWAEERGGTPSHVISTGSKDDIGILRIDFPGFSGEGKLEPISWDDFFRKFDERNLSLLYQETTADGQKSNFNKLISGETARKAAGKSGGRSRAKSAGGSSSSRSSRSSASAKKTAGTKGKSTSAASGSRQSSARKSAGSKSAAKGSDVTRQRKAPGLLAANPSSSSSSSKMPNFKFAKHTGREARIRLACRWLRVAQQCITQWFIAQQCIARQERRYESCLRIEGQKFLGKRFFVKVSRIAGPVDIRSNSQEFEPRQTGLARAHIQRSRHNIKSG